LQDCGKQTTPTIPCYSRALAFLTKGIDPIYRWQNQGKIREPFMRTQFVAAIAVLTAVTTTGAFAQGQTAPKASKAEVQKLVGNIKSDKTKLAQYCEITKLEIQSNALAEKNENDPKLEGLGKQMDDLSAKLGPDYQRITGSDLDDASSALFDDLSKSCNVGFKPQPAAPKVTKADVQNLVNGIKGDKTKLSQFCGMTKLATQAAALAQKNKNDPKLQALGKQMDDLSEKLGPDYERITTAELDDASAAPLTDLYKSCK
jgi:hypothetical protein